jgi:LysR family transcriptional activator of dmlA
MIAAFTAQHPGLSAHLLPSDAGLEVGLDACDVVLRFGLPDDAGMIARKLVRIDCVLVAAPGYIARRGAPARPSELLAHNCLRLQRRHRLIHTWHFEKDGTCEEVKVDGTLSITNGEVLLQWALSGEGISLEALWDVTEYIDQGLLVQIIPTYRCPPNDLYAVYAPGTPVPPRIRLFVDYVGSSLSRLTLSRDRQSLTTGRGFSEADTLDARDFAGLHQDVLD